MEAGSYGPAGATSARRRLTTETKSALKTTEFAAYVIVALAILIAAAVVSGGDSAGGADYFQADKAWLYVTLLTIGYMLSRGLAKSGSRDPYWDDPSAGGGGSVTDRVKAAAQVLAEGEGAQAGDTRTTQPRTGSQY